MSRFSSFFPDRTLPPAEEERVISKRFQGDKGPLRWRARAATEAQAAAARAAATTRRQGRNGPVEERDGDVYARELAVRCLVCPDLYDAELQEAWGVKTPGDLLGKMLLPGEYAELCRWIASLCGFDRSDTELVEDAKH